MRVRCSHTASRAHGRRSRVLRAGWFDTRGGAMAWLGRRTRAESRARKRNANAGAKPGAQKNSVINHHRQSQSQSDAHAGAWASVSGLPRDPVLFDAVRARMFLYVVVSLVCTPTVLFYTQVPPTRSPAHDAVLRLTAGTLATVVVRTVLAPFERVKLEYMLNQSRAPLLTTFSRLLCDEGVRGFWRGNVVNLLRTAPYKAINFAVFDALRGGFAAAAHARELERLHAATPTANAPQPSHARQHINRHHHHHHAHEVHIGQTALALAGAGAGIAAVVTCFPMDVVRTRLLVHGGWGKYGSIAKCIALLHREEGIGAFYRGIVPALLSMAPNGAVYYTIYDRLKNARIKALTSEGAAKLSDAEGWGERGGKNKKTTTVQQLSSSSSSSRGAGAVTIIEPEFMMLFGAVAGATAELTTYPLEVVRRRMQLQAGASTVGQVVGRQALRRMALTFRVIVAKGGAAGLYAGAVPSVMQVLPSSALGYLTYEMFKVMLHVT